jgi:hypothetical protein
MIAFAGEEAPGVIRDSLEVAQERAADETVEDVRMVLEICPGMNQVRDRRLELCTAHCGRVAGQHENLILIRILKSQTKYRVRFDWAK